MNIFQIWKKLRAISLIKTFWLNLKYFPLKTALKFPIVVSKYTNLYCTKGKIQVNVPVSSAMLIIGMRNIGIIDTKHIRTLWEVKGTITLNGKASIGGGSKICVGENGNLVLGNNFQISGSSSIICSKRIEFGNNCLLSWDILMMDTDGHIIKNEQNEIINQPVPIKIGDHVWIGCRNTILKGVEIGSNSIIAANSTITKSTYEKHVIYGNNSIVLKKGINWEL